MKTIALSIVALTAVTGAAFANDRSEDGTAAWRNVNYGAVWADRPLMREMQGLAVMQQSAPERSDFAIRKLRGENFGNDN